MRRKIAMVCAFPPPMGGAAKNSELIHNELVNKIDVVKINTSVGIISHGRSLIYHFRRFVKLVNNIFLLVFLLIGRLNHVYIVPDGGMGLIYTLLYVSIASIFRVKLVFHYRNYSYIENKSILLALCIKFAGTRLMHIFLDENMRCRFESVYGSGLKHLIFLNTAFLDGIENKVVPKRDLVIGHMSNLCQEKGLYDFIDLIEKFGKDINGIKFIIAGSPVNKNDADAVHEICKKYKNNVSYFGVVDKKNKSIFYESIDIFVFPTHFKQEAQPNVIFEAMAHNCICISYDRGSIKWMLEGCGFAFEQESDFACCAKSKILELKNDKKELSILKDKTLMKIKKLKIEGDLQYKSMLRYFYIN